MSTVFIIQQRKPKDDGWVPDYSTAAQYGKIDVLFGQEDQPSLDMVWAQRVTENKLRGFSHDDYLLWAGGDPIGIALAFLVARKQGVDRIGFLRWERRRNENGERVGGFYMPVLIPV